MRRARRGPEDVAFASADGMRAETVPMRYSVALLGVAGKALDVASGSAKISPSAGTSRSEVFTFGCLQGFSGVVVMLITA